MDMKQVVAIVFDGDLDLRYVEPYITPISIVWTWKNLYYPNIYDFGESEELGNAWHEFKQRQPYLFRMRQMDWEWC